MVDTCSWSWLRRNLCLPVSHLPLFHNGRYLFPFRQVTCMQSQFNFSIKNAIPISKIICKVNPIDDTQYWKQRLLLFEQHFPKRTFCAQMVIGVTQMDMALTFCKWVRIVPCHVWNHYCITLPRLPIGFPKSSWCQNPCRLEWIVCVCQCCSNSSIANLKLTLLQYWSCCFAQLVVVPVSMSAFCRFSEGGLTAATLLWNACCRNVLVLPTEKWNYWESLINIRTSSDTSARYDSLSMWPVTLQLEIAGCRRSPSVISVLSLVCVLPPLSTRFCSIILIWKYTFEAVGCCTVMLYDYQCTVVYQQDFAVIAHRIIS